MTDHTQQPRTTLYSAFATTTQDIATEIAYARNTTTTRSPAQTTLPPVVVTPGATESQDVNLATRASWTENQAASAGSATRHGTTTVDKFAVGITIRNERDSRENPNTAHLSHLQEAMSINITPHPIIVR